MLASLLLNSIYACPNLRFSVRLMNRESWGSRRQSTRFKYVRQSKSSSRGASSWAIRSSKYSLRPQNSNSVREGRAARIGGSGYLLLCSGGGGNGNWKSTQRVSSLVNIARPATIASGEM